MIEEALYSLITGDGTVSGLMSTRLYPVHLPQSPTFPAAAYRMDDSEPKKLLAADTNILESRFEIAAFAETYDACRSLADAIRAAVQRYSGTVASVVIMDITLDNIDDDYEPDLEIYERTLDITVTYRV